MFLVSQVAPESACSVHHALRCASSPTQTCRLIGGGCVGRTFAVILYHSGDFSNLCQLTASGAWRERLQRRSARPQRT